MIMLDTHIAVAFYDGHGGGFSSEARRALDREAVAISPAVLLELELLHEIGRLREGAGAIALRLRDQLDIRVAGDRFVDVTRAALSLGFTRDPFDRLIVAHAMLLKASLVTHDALLGRHYAAALN
jgi:PIN domain nuclease of toxin-antitoxin system